MTDVEFVIIVFLVFLITLCLNAYWRGYDRGYQQAIDDMKKAPIKRG